MSWNPKRSVTAPFLFHPIAMRMTEWRAKTIAGAFRKRVEHVRRKQNAAYSQADKMVKKERTFFQHESAGVNQRAIGFYTSAWNCEVSPSLNNVILRYFLSLLLFLVSRERC